MCVWLAQLAQKDVPVPEGNLKDKHLEQAAARTRGKTYDEGHIAPHPGLQVQGSSDPKQQEEDAKYWLMQPVYTHEYTESVQPQHLPTNTVGSIISADLNADLAEHPVLIMTTLCKLLMLICIAVHVQFTA